MPPKQTMNKKTAAKKAPAKKPAAKKAPAKKPAAKANGKGKTKREESREVAVKEDTTVSTNVAEAMAESAGEGLEFGAGEVKRPVIKLVQSMSPYLKKLNEKYIEEAEVGDIFITGHNYLYDSVPIIVLGYTHNYVEWKPLDDGGGLVGAHPFRPGIVEGLERGKGGVYIAEDGNELHDTMCYYVLYENPDGQWEPAMLFMKSTMLSVARELNTRLDGRMIKTANGSVKAPIFGNIVVLGTREHQGAQHEWMKFTIEDIRFIEDMDLLNRAKEESRQFRKMMSNIDFSASAEGGGEASEDTTASDNDHF